MTVKRIIIPMIVERSMLQHGASRIDKWFGYTDVDASECDLCLQVFVPGEYEELPIGEVFFPWNDDGCYPKEEPSHYLIKMPRNNWYLTGDEERPLGIDKTQYEKIWRVK
jgi:hypothetical protein